MSSWRSSKERIPNLQIREPTEVTIRAPQLLHRVIAAERRDPGVVHSRTSNVATLQD
jgi:hypothetical protein